ncbi:hypothetical protein [Rhizobium sp. HT1-10]|uniref:hypothetical protein n=1 Tax=Rhizobium sp. HT1-10 TaxID=3111638 RepID=UPI003C293659
MDSDKSSKIPNTYIDVDTLKASKIPFFISLISILGICFFAAFENMTGNHFFGAVNAGDLPIYRLLVPNIIYIILTLCALIFAYIGYRLTVASGATAAPVIPPQDYELLSPLISEGKTESIDQYVRLSSLTKFTGTFTQLGLTGLPLATIFLTLFFSVLTIIGGSSFLDLTKLTLGAFIGSFVQRQVERGSNSSSKDRSLLGEAKVPRERI